MRGLNLARLARSSEGAFFAEKQAAQASKIRSKLSPAELAATQAAPSADLQGSVDVLGEIAAHSAYRRIVRNTTRLAVQTAPKKSSPVMAVTGATIARSKANASEKVVDPGVLKVLGSNKLNVYASLRDEASKTAMAREPPPGTAVYGEAAVVGVASLAIATGLVASVGAGSLIYVYMNPQVIDVFREKSLAFRATIDASVGERMRNFSKSLSKNGPWLSDESTVAAQQIAAKAVHGSTGAGRSPLTMPESEHELSEPVSVQRG